MATAAGLVDFIETWRIPDLREALVKRGACKTHARKADYIAVLKPLMANEPIDNWSARDLRAALRWRKVDLGPRAVKADYVVAARRIVAEDRAQRGLTVTWAPHPLTTSITSDDNDHGEAVHKKQRCEAKRPDLAGLSLSSVLIEAIAHWLTETDLVSGTRVCRQLNGLWSLRLHGLVSAHLAARRTLQICRVQRNQAFPVLYQVGLRCCRLVHVSLRGVRHWSSGSYAFGNLVKNNANLRILDISGEDGDASSSSDPLKWERLNALDRLLPLLINGAPHLDRLTLASMFLEGHRAWEAPPSRGIRRIAQIEARGCLGDGLLDLAVYAVQLRFEWSSAPSNPGYSSPFVHRSAWLYGAATAPFPERIQVRLWPTATAGDQADIEAFLIQDARFTGAAVSVGLFE